MTSSKLGSITLALMLTPGLLSAQDLTGLWDIQASFTLPLVNQSVLAAANCEYSGTGISLAQNGDLVSGTVDLNLDGGPTDCPGAIISATLAATLRGSSFVGTLTGSQLLGTAAVDGSIATLRQSSAATVATTTMKGLADVNTGSFFGASGNFAGQQLPIAPALGPVAVGVMALILFGGTVLLLTRRDRAAI